jgi:iron complex outermembrane receptor protein
MRVRHHLDAIAGIKFDIHDTLYHWAVIAALCSKKAHTHMIDRSAIKRLVALAAVAAGPASADEAIAPRAEIVVTADRPGKLLKIAPTGSRLNLTPLETPATVNVVDGDELRARGDLTVNDAVTRAPGITTSANPGNGGTALVSRGFSGQGSVLQLIDGVRLFPVAGTITFPVDPWTVDRIEILNGPASVLYGQGALGGAVNVISRHAPDTPQYDAFASFGSQNNLNIAGGAGGPIGGGLGYRVDASFRRSDGFVDRGQSRSLALSGELRWAPRAGFALTLRHDHGNQRPMEYFGTPLIAGRLDPANRRRNYNVADADLHYIDNRTVLALDWTFADGVVLTNAAYRLTSERLFRNLENYAFVPATGLIRRSANFGIFHDQTQYGNQASLAVRRPVFGLANDFVVGFDVNDIALTYSHSFATAPQVDFVDPFVFAPGLFLDTQGIAPRFRTATLEYSVFAEDRLKLTDTLSIVAGLRAEWNRVKRWTIAGGGTPQATETFLFDARLSNTTWRIGTIWQPTPDISLYGQYATGVDPLGTLSTLSVAQSQLKNTPGDQIEAGVKVSFLGGRGMAMLVAYRIVKRNLLIRNPDNLLDLVPIQVGQRSSRGVEVAVSVELAGGFGIDANATVLDARFDRFNNNGVVFDGRTPQNIPEASGNLWLRWTAANGIETRAGVRAVGRMFSDNANTFRIPGYAVVDGGVIWPLTANIAIEGRVQNLFDKAYATTSYANAQWLLGRPRSIDVAVRARF